MLIVDNRIAQHLYHHMSMMVFVMLTVTTILRYVIGMAVIVARLTVNLARYIYATVFLIVKIHLGVYLIDCWMEEKFI